MVRAGKGLACAQLGEHGADIGDRADHPFELRIGKALGGERSADSMIGDDAAALQCGAFVEFDGVVGDRSGFELFGNARLHVAGCLADLELPLMRRVGNRVGVDARVGFGFGSEDVLDGRFVHSSPPFVGRIMLSMKAISSAVIPYFS
ncbi:hypothetical protein [Sphingopyxis sp. GC21]|uniref:hypothetical protein n=1 Tax=Sphingopyxis sp. GC21 TaxID=2933562 RepID=UPI0021E4FE79|nr:hypothetical protein [Sphingopyxis sp. GC21]